MLNRYIPTKIGHRAVEAAGLLHLGGVLPNDTSADMKGQVEQIIEKIEAILAEIGSDKKHLVSATIYITDFSQKAAMDAAWLAWIPAEQLPARVTVGVADLGKGVLAEIAVTAVRKA